MANTLTYLVPDAIQALEIVSRELTGFIPAVQRDASLERVAKGTSIRSPVASAQSFGSITPAATPPAFSDQTDSYRTIQMNNLYGSRFYYTGEEKKGLTLSGAYPSLFAQKCAQAYRVAANAIDTAIGALYTNASRAYGTAATTPCASSIADIAALEVMLDVNGAPRGDRHLVVNSALFYNLLKLTQLTNVNQSGTGGVLNNAVLPPLFGFQVHTSQGVASHTAGTSTGQDCTAIEPVAETTIAYDGGDGGTILDGDVFAPASDVSDPAGAASKYVCNTAVTAASGNIVINSPGLLDATAINEELARSATYRANLAFSRDAFILATRPPEGDDVAVDEAIITDPVTGLSFRLAQYKGYHGTQYELSILYGVGEGPSAHSVILLG